MLIRQGAHRAVPVSAVLGKSPKSGTPNVCVWFKIQGGDDDGAEVPWWGYLTHKTYDRTIEGLRYCGWVGDDLADLRSIEQSERVVEVHVEHNEYNGKTNARVAFVNRPGARAAAALPEADARAIADEWREKVAEVSKRVKLDDPADELKDDDVPF